MASTLNMCASCLRATRRSASKAAIQSRPSYSSRAFSRVTAAGASRPLYLDFLVPHTFRKTYTSPSIAAPSAQKSLTQRIPRRTLATAADPSAARPAQAVLNPRNDESGNPMHIAISPRASNRLHAISSGDKNPNLALRVSIESGGCHGFQYLMDLTDLAKSPATEEDTVFQGEKGEKVVVDESSLELLNGSTVDYTMELIGSQFKITGIPGATSSCGCGTSFDIKL
jgi:iron-sulfur cluster assembly accessory protein